MSKIKDKHIYHGAALSQIAEHNSFTAINRNNISEGAYKINEGKNIMIKYVSSPKGQKANFNFVLTELGHLTRMNDFFLCLVCGKDTICCLSESETDQIIDINGTRQQMITVYFPKNKSMEVKGNKGKLAQKIPHSAFPNKIFR